MAFFRNILSSKHVDTDMEAGNVELEEMKASRRSAPYPQWAQPAAHYSQPAAHYPHSLDSDAMSPGPETLLPPSQISSTALNVNRKRSYSEDRTSKVRVVEQGSKMSTIVRISIKLKKLTTWVSIERDWEAVSGSIRTNGNGTPREGGRTAEQG